MKKPTQYFLLIIALIASCRVPLKDSKSGLRGLATYQFSAQIKVNEKLEFSVVPGPEAPHIVEIVPVIDSKQASSEKIAETGLALGDVSIKRFSAKVSKDEKSSENIIDCITISKDLTQSISDVVFDCTEDLRDGPIAPTPSVSPTPTPSPGPTDTSNQNSANQKYCVCHAEPVATTVDGKVWSQGAKKVDYDQKVDKDASCSTLDSKILSDSRRLSNCVDVTIDNQKTCRCTQRKTRDDSSILENQPYTVEGGDCSKLNKTYPDFVLYDCK